MYSNAYEPFLLHLTHVLPILFFIYFNICIYISILSILFDGLLIYKLY